MQKKKVKEKEKKIINNIIPIVCLPINMIRTVLLRNFINSFVILFLSGRCVPCFTFLFLFSAVLCPIEHTRDISIWEIASAVLRTASRTVFITIKYDLRRVNLLQVTFIQNHPEGHNHHQNQNGIFFQMKIDRDREKKDEQWKREIYGINQS